MDNGLDYSINKHWNPGCIRRYGLYIEELVKSWTYLISKIVLQRTKRDDLLIWMPDATLPEEVWQYKSVSKESIGSPRKGCWNGCIPLELEQVICLDPNRRRREKSLEPQVYVIIIGIISLLTNDCLTYTINVNSD